MEKRIQYVRNYESQIGEILSQSVFATSAKQQQRIRLAIFPYAFQNN